jgi:hypothetical protein
LYKLIQLEQVGLPQALGIADSPTFAGLTLSSLANQDVGIVTSGTNGALVRVAIGTGLSIVNGALVASGSAGTNLTYNPDTRLLSSSTGDDVTLPLATSLVSGLQSSTDKAKLDSITVDVATKTREPARNTTGTLIPKGSVVRVPSPGSSGETLLIALADASEESTAANTLGFTESDIDHNSNGFVLTEGELSGINTDHLVEGGLIFLSETTGQTTSVRPVPPAHGVILGWCKKKGPGTSGAIYVKVDNGQELNELHDVLITGSPPAVGAPRPTLVLSSDGLWRNSLLTPSDVGAVTTDDPRLTDAREWTAETISQAEAEEGTATTRRGMTALRVRQAVEAWWQTVSSSVGRAVVGAVDDAAARGAIGAGTSDLALSAQAPANLAATAAAGSSDQAAPADHAHQFQPEALIVELSDQDTANTTPKTLRTVQYWPKNFTLLETGVWSAKVAPIGAAMQFDIRINGTSIFQTLPTIDATENSSATAAVPAVFSTAFIASGNLIPAQSVLSFHLTQAGTSGGVELHYSTDVRRAS